MSKTTKRQIGFYADDDVSEYLDTLSQNTKTRTINAALRAWKESRLSIEEPGYTDIFESMVAWLGTQIDPITVSTMSGQKVSLAGLLHKFLHQERLRQPSMTWPEIASGGVTFAMPTTTPDQPRVREDRGPLLVPASPHNRCAACQKPLLNPAEAINTPSRGRICRACFELPFPKR
jgi:hypothetical protein